MTTTHAAGGTATLAHPPTHEEHILVASAGDSSALGAVRMALALSQRKDASVRVITVAAPFPHLAPPALKVAPPALVDEDNRRAALEAVRTQLATLPGTKEWTVRAAMGWPADCILEAAESWPATLIIVGLGEHGATDRLFGSESAVAIARKSRLPVLAVPPDAKHLPTRAVAAIDFTESSVNAAREAARLVGPDGALTLLHASLLVKPHAAAGSLLDVYTAGAREKLDAIRDRLHRDTKHQVRIHGEVASGEIVDALLAYVNKHRCDLLALGGHEHSLVDQFLLGSVRTRVIRHAHCPVLVTPKPDEE